MSGDGGPAFPKDEQRWPDGEPMMRGSEGMSLRDYFAAQAIPPAISTKPQGIKARLRALLGWDFNAPYPKPEAVAVQAYRVADAMLAERARAKP